MTTTPSEPASNPNLQPGDVPDGHPSRPHGDPVMPDQDEDHGTSSEDPGDPAEPQTFPVTDPEAE